METIMAGEHDMPKRRPLRKTPKETPDEAEARLSRELAYLMRDPRYRDGDPDYRAYIHRQFRRVYDDPTGEPQPLRLGRPKVFVDALEPFDPIRERRLRQGREEARKGGGQPAGSVGSRRARMSSLGEANQRDWQVRETSQTDEVFDIPPPSERAMSELEGNARRHGPDPESAHRNYLTMQERLARLPRTLEVVDAMIASWRRDGSDLAADYFERYRDGVGGTISMAWSDLLSFPKFHEEQETLKGHYLDWVNDKLDDDLWTPFLQLADGENVTVSTNGKGGPLKLVAVWGPVTFDSVFDHHDGMDRDFARAFGQGEIESFGNLSFIRRGKTIFVSGFVEMRLDETFDFETGVLGPIGSFAAADAPTVSNSDLRDLATLGTARPFATTSQKLWQVDGRIVLNEDGTPDPSKTQLVWTDADLDEPAQ